ncbi:glutathione S-transferase [Cochlodiniinecator piscidefendens]|uniref:glutathione S-transferase n=1 Tax=Cochlodiniinecator piscidefendens TaxID=2715756 RepID=UPI00140E58E4|nr:glutathione S-transferase [Cochlodiniinecator piscidefendens]
MTYQLFIGDRAYSSWSLRGWLLFERFGIPVSTTMVDFSDEKSWEQVKGFAPARTVPTLITPEGAVVSESIAIAEELASRHPEAGVWPVDPKARAVARTLTAEMHAGFGALREMCPMNLRVAYTDFTPNDAVVADLRRLDLIWDHARQAKIGDGPWLLGDYSAADAFFAPVAARIAGYGLRVSPSAQAYVDAHLSDLAFRRWRAMGLVRGEDLPWYRRDFAKGSWPGPEPMTAQIANGPSENATCPYSGDPSVDFLTIEGRVFGFCNPFCRDKTMADPAAWPAFMKIYQS